MGMCLGTIETLKEKRHQVSLYLYIANACFVSMTKVLVPFLLIRNIKIQVSDTTMFNQGTKAGSIKFINSLVEEFDQRVIY